MISRGPFWPLCTKGDNSPRIRSGGYLWLPGEAWSHPATLSHTSVDSKIAGELKGQHPLEVVWFLFPEWGSEKKQADSRHYCSNSFHHLQAIFCLKTLLSFLQFGGFSAQLPLPSPSLAWTASPTRTPGLLLWESPVHVPNTFLVPVSKWRCPSPPILKISVFLILLLLPNTYDFLKVPLKFSPWFLIISCSSPNNTTQSNTTFYSYSTKWIILTPVWEITVIHFQILSASCKSFMNPVSLHQKKRLKCRKMS